MPFVYTPTGQQQYSEEEIRKALASGGWWKFEQAPDINVIDAEGRKTSIPFTADQVGKALNAGFRFESPEEEQQAYEEEKYGSGLQAVAGGAEALLSGATLGVSDVVLSQLGVNPEEMRARREAGGALTTGLEVTGALVPAVMSGGATAPESLAATGARTVPKLLKAGTASVLRKTPAALVARGSRAVERELVKVLGDTAKGRILAAGTAQAGEGAIYGLGAAISDAALNDKPLTSEQVMANVGLGALIGGGAGGGLKGMGELVGAGVRKGKALIQAAKSADEAGEPGLFAKASGKVTGQDPKKIQKYLDAGEEGRELRRIATEDPEKLRNDLVEEWRRLEDEVMDDFDPVTDYHKKLKPEQMRALAKEGVEDDIVQSYDALADGISQRLDEAIAAGEGQFTDQAALKRLRKIFGYRDAVVDQEVAKLAKLPPDKLAKQFEEVLERGEDPLAYLEALKAAGARDGSLGATVHNAMDKFKKELGIYARRLARKRDKGPTHWETFELYRDIYERLRPHLEDTRLYGEAAEAQAKVNAPFSEFLSGQGFKANFKLHRQVGQQRDPAKAFEGKWGADPGQMRRMIDAIDDPDGALDWEHWEKFIANRLKVAEAIGDSYKLSAKDAQRIARIRGNTGKIQKLLKEAKRIVSVQKELGDIARRGIGREAVIGLGAAGYIAAGPAGLAAGAVIPALLDPSKAIHTRAILDRIGMVTSAASATRAKVKAGLDHFFGGKPIKRTVRAGTVPAAVKAYLPLDSGDSGDNLQSAYRRVRSDIEKTVSNPEILQNRMSKRLALLDQSQPELATHVALAAVRAASYLMSTAPTGSQPDPIKVARGDDEDLPDSEIRKWFRRFETVEDPASALESLADGTLTQEQRETLQAVYPRMYQDIVQQAMERVASGEKLSYSKRVQLSMLLDQPLDRSMQPGAVAFYQESAARQRMTGAIAQAATGAGSGSKKMTETARKKLVGGNLTQAQRLASEV